MQAELEKNKTYLKLKLTLGKHAGYILGVSLGLVLIVVNVYIGLTMITILLDERIKVAEQKGLSLPVIQTGNYDNAKVEYNRRQNKIWLGGDVGEDPFRLN